MSASIPSLNLKRNVFRVGAILFFALFAAPSFAAPRLSALLSHETLQTSADGVTRISRYQERYIRDRDTIWLARVLPASAPHDARENPAPHDELNLYTVPRLIRAAADGAAALNLVDEEHHQLYSTGQEDYERVGFSGRWAAEASLLDPKSLQNMKPSARHSDVAGARWYELDQGGEYSRVLWSEALQFPLDIETGTRDGRSSSRTRVILQRDDQKPWQQLSGYAQRELGDLGD